MQLAPHIQQTLQDLERKLAEREQAVVDAKKQINQFCLMFELPAPYPDEAEAAGPSSFGVVLRPDEFANDRYPGVAIQHLLELRGKERGALFVDEAFRLLRAHGFPFDQRMSEERQMHVVRTAIGKDRKLTRHAANDTVGLTEWYPNRKRPKKVDSGASPDTDADADADESEDEEETEETSESAK